VAPPSERKNAALLLQKAVAMANKLRRNRCVQFKDEVYRQMFLLEERRSGAELGLAIALLRAWLDVESKPATEDDRAWLEKVSPICLDMITTAVQTLGNVYTCGQ